MVSWCHMFLMFHMKPCLSVGSVLWSCPLGNMHMQNACLSEQWGFAGLVLANVPISNSLPLAEASLRTL